MADFNFHLNRQGVQGVKGDKGDTGFSPTIEVDTNTAAEYKLKITNENNQFVTDNLRGSAVEDLGGTYMRYNREDGTMYAGNPDYATYDNFGEVRFATDEDIELGAEDKAVGADKLYEVNQTLDEHSSTMTSLQTQIDEIEGEIPTVGDGTLTITFDGSTAGTFSANQSSDTTISLTSPTIDSALSTESTNAVQNKIVTSRINSLESDTAANLNLKADKTTVSTLQTTVTSIEEVIPNQAASSNQLADKAFVNSSIATNTATFRGTFNSVADLEAYTGEHDINDYAFVISTDTDGNTVYNRYKFDGTNWVFEYALNNSSFTAVQFEAINSGITTTLVSQITTNQTNITKVADSIHDGTLTLTQSGSTLGTFSANASLNATIDIPSMTTPDKDFIKQSKGLLSGAVSSNTEVYNELLERFRSTFDVSKFGVTGTPTVTNDGIATNLTTNNFLYKALTAGTYSNLEIGFNFVYRGSAGYISKFGGFGCFYQIYINTNGAWSFEIITTENNQQVIKTILVNDVTLTQGAEYNVKIKVEGLTLKCSVTNLSTNVEKHANTTLSEAFAIRGAFPNALVLYQVTSADYKKAYINIDGVPIFSGNITGADNYTIGGQTVSIPYTLSSNGSKFVDVAYREDVEDLYEQEGEALYYTIDTVNKNFTIPACDLYGAIQKQKDTSVVSTAARSIVTITQSDYDLLDPPDPNTLYIIVASSN